MPPKRSTISKQAKASNTPADSTSLRRSKRGAAGQTVASKSAEAGSTDVDDEEQPVKRRKNSKKFEKTSAREVDKVSALKNKSSKSDPEKPKEYGGPSYWLLKAEPNTRLENGIDVKFSIDDLEACTEPEPWEGVRNYVARNNMMAMKKGELAFFYHSNCKVPGVAGICTIAEESSVDKSAFDTKHPYHDPKSDPAKPRWFHVHVTFVRKFAELIPLKQLQKHKGPAQALEGMQMLKQSRLSVNKVAKAEWDFIMELVENKKKELQEEKA